MSATKTPDKKANPEKVMGALGFELITAGVGGFGLRLAVKADLKSEEELGALILSQVSALCESKIYKVVDRTTKEFETHGIISRISCESGTFEVKESLRTSDIRVVSSRVSWTDYLTLSDPKTGKALLEIEQNNNLDYKTKTGTIIISYKGLVNGNEWFWINGDPLHPVPMVIDSAFGLKKRN
jgi:hypothetical protein